MSPWPRPPGSGRAIGRRPRRSHRGARRPRPARRGGAGRRSPASTASRRVPLLRVSESDAARHPPADAAARRGERRLARCSPCSRWAPPPRRSWASGGARSACCSPSATPAGGSAASSPPSCWLPRVLAGLAGQLLGEIAAGGLAGRLLGAAAAARLSPGAGSRRRPAWPWLVVGSAMIVALRRVERLDAAQVLRGRVEPIAVALVDVQGLCRRFGALARARRPHARRRGGGVGGGDRPLRLGQDDAAQRPLRPRPRRPRGRCASAASTSTALSARELARYRQRTVGLVFQQFHLIPYLTALENVMLAQYVHSMTDRAEAEEALRRVGLGEPPPAPAVASSRAASSSASASPARSSTSRRSCSPTSPPATSTRSTRRSSCRSSPTSTSAATRWCW